MNRLSLLMVFPLGLCACIGPGSVPAVKTAEVPAGGAQRIVSLAPSITEILFALGAGERVVGVTAHCHYPPEAQQKTKVGGFLDANAEAIVALAPDLVLVPPNAGDLMEQLERAGLNSVPIEQFSVSDILKSIATVGRLCNAEAQAQVLTGAINTRLDRVRALTQDLSRPRVLISVGRDYSAPGLTQVYIAAGNSFYGELTALAGGDNAYKSAGFAYPVVSAEGIMQLQPDAVFEVVADRAEKGTTPEQVLAGWQTLPELPAVKDGRVYILDADYVGIPGPRVAQIVEDIAAKLHPEVKF